VVEVGGRWLLRRGGGGIPGGGGRWCASWMVGRRVCSRLAAFGRVRWELMAVSMRLRVGYRLLSLSGLPVLMTVAMSVRRYSASLLGVVVAVEVWYNNTCS